jgi:hypothetical protein
LRARGVPGDGDLAQDVEGLRLGLLPAYAAESASTSSDALGQKPVAERA